MTVEILRAALDLDFCEDCDFIGDAAKHTRTHHCRNIGFAIGDRREVSTRAIAALSHILSTP